ncbi:MAG: hypothetical protein JWQ40_2869 [Segetibacter sp.]|jgi:hypothetical protein|nr:hypothetical protein [Segetibacter sp.]
MKQTFYKTLHGHKLEFNRLLYPVHYNVITKDGEKAEGKKFLLARDETNMWRVKKTEDLPNWFDEISMDVHNTIADNEYSPIN